MSKECKSYTDLLHTLSAQKKQQETPGGLELTQSTANAPWMSRLLLRLGKMVSGVGTEKDISDAIKKEFGAPDESKKLATILLSLVEKNPGLEGIIRDHLAYETTRLGDDFELKWQLDKDGNRAPDFSSLPVPVLKGAINEMKSILKHGFGENIGKGLLGKVRLQFTTPKRMAKKESTGALYNMRKTVRDYPGEMGNKVNKFMKADPAKSDYVQLTNMKTGKKGLKKIRDYGMADILERISNLSNHESLARLNSSMNKIILHDMFTRYTSDSSF